MKTCACAAEQCGYRWVVADDADEQPCPQCGTETDPPHRLPNEHRDKMADLCVRFFTRVGADELAAQAEAGESIVARLLDGMGTTQIWTARGFLGRAGLDYIAQADESEMEAILDVMVSGGSDVGLVCWSNRDWSIDEMKRARDVMLAA